MDKPYHIVVSIIRGTNVGRALSLMHSGIQCVHESETVARSSVDKYLDCAAVILDHVPTGICFGVVVLMDTRTGTILRTETLMGRNTQTTLGK